MKLKGITIWEQHAEKMVVGLALLVFLVFLAWQFISDPHSEQVGNVVYTPRNVDRLVSERAEQLGVRLRSDVDVFDIGDVSLVTADDFSQRLAMRMRRNLPLVQHRIAPRPEEVVQVDREFIVPDVPEPTSIVVRQYADALSDDVVSEFREELASYLPPAPEPPDMRYLTVAARFPNAEYLQNLRREDPDGGKLSVYETWYHGRTHIVDVVVERQEQIAGGRWGNTTHVDLLPGQYSLRPQLEGEDEEFQIDATTRDVILNQLNDASTQRYIAQPPFYPTRNESWVHPFSSIFDEVPDAAEDDPISRLLRELAFRQAQLDDVERLMEAEGIPFDRDDRGPDRPDQPGGGPPPPQGSGGGGLAPPGGGGEERRNERRAEFLRNRRARILADIRMLREQLENLGWTEERIEEVSPFDPAESDYLEVWAHDITAEPGKTYRYRLKVRVYNPFFARRLNLIESQQHLADAFYTESPYSEWSEPVRVQPMQVIYAVNATPPRSDGVGSLRDLGTATVEVFRFYDGRWWMREFRIQPGDQIGVIGSRGRPGEASDISFETNWFLADCIPDVERPGTAWVVWQNIRTGEVSDLIDPSEQVSNPERVRLRDLVREAERQQAHARR